MASNICMIFPGYVHGRNPRGKPRPIAAIASGGIACFEYLLPVRSDRIGYGAFRLGRLRILQEMIMCTVCVVPAFFYMRPPLQLDFLWVALCIVAVAHFVMFHSHVS
ncbi:MAG: DMT family protein [Acidiferrobacteraceae bacterium]